MASRSVARPKWRAGQKKPVITLSVSPPPAAPAEDLGMSVPLGKPTMDMGFRRSSMRSHASQATFKSQRTELALLQARRARMSTGSKATRRGSRVTQRLRSAEFEELEEIAEALGGSRGFVLKVLANTRFDTFMGIVIILNLFLMVMQTNTKVKEFQNGGERQDASDWHDAVDLVFLTIYIMELGARVYAYREEFIRATWNIVDTIIVLMGVLDAILNRAGSSQPNVSMATVLRVVRIMRLVRVVRILSFFDELDRMVKGFYSAMKAMFWGGVMIFLQLLLWSIFAIELIDGMDPDYKDNREYCEAAFSTVQRCMLMFFQTLVAGDSWGACAVPLVRETWWTVFIFAGALISISLGFTNLILAVIVDRAQQASRIDRAKQVEENNKKRSHATQRIREALESIDEDKSSTISWKELEKGYDVNKELQDLFALLTIQKEDLKQMFDYMAVQNENEPEPTASYDAFIVNLRKAEQQGFGTQMMMFGLAVQKIDRFLKGLDREREMAAVPSKVVPSTEAAPSMEAAGSIETVPSKAKPTNRRATLQEKDLQLNIAGAKVGGAIQKRADKLKPEKDADAEQPSKQALAEPEPALPSKTAESESPPMDPVVAPAAIAMDATDTASPLLPVRQPRAGAAVSPRPRSTSSSDPTQKPAKAMPQATAPARLSRRPPQAAATGQTASARPAWHTERRKVAPPPSELMTAALSEKSAATATSAPAGTLDIGRSTEGSTDSSSMSRGWQRPNSSGAGAKASKVQKGKSTSSTQKPAVSKHSVDSDAPASASKSSKRS